MVATLRELSTEDIKRVLTEPRDALVKQFQRLFEMDRVKLTFTEGAIAAIAEQSKRRKTGARGLRSTIEGILLDTMFELPLIDDLVEVVVSEEAVNSGSPPLRIFSDRKSRPAIASG